MAAQVQSQTKSYGICNRQSTGVRVLSLPWQFSFHQVFHIHYLPIIKAIGAVTGYGQGVSSSPARARFFSSPCHSDRFWGPPSLLCNGYWEHSGQGMKLITHLQLVPRSRIRNFINPLPHTPSWHSA
jgi:hypothetical protein